MTRIFIFILLMLLPLTSRSQTVEVESIVYEINVTDGEAKVVDVTSHNLVEYSIQEAVEYGGKRYPVTAIGYRAFDYLNYATSITIPNSVKRIGKSAFAYCGDLKYIKLPDGLESIEDYTFRWCSSFSKIVPYTMAEEEGDSCLFFASIVEAYRGRCLCR